MKKLITLIAFIGVFSYSSAQVVRHYAQEITREQFLVKVFNYPASPNKWVFAGNKPCIVDFYAVWCGPCKRVAPILEELAREYEGKLDIYKVNTEEQKQLATDFAIRSIPTIFFCPVEGTPKVINGALPKEEIEKIIREFLLIEKPVVQ